MLPGTGPWTRTALLTTGNLHRFGACLAPLFPPADLEDEAPAGNRLRLAPPARGRGPAADLPPTTNVPPSRLPRSGPGADPPPLRFVAVVADPASSRDDPDDSEEDSGELESEDSSSAPPPAPFGPPSLVVDGTPNPLTSSLMATDSFAYMAPGERS